MLNWGAWSVWTSWLSRELWSVRSSVADERGCLEQFEDQVEKLASLEWRGRGAARELLVELRRVC